MQVFKTLKSFSAKTVTTLCLSSLCSISAFADWSRSSIAGMDTWVYDPAGTTESRSMMLVLHGCAQTHTELKDHGNLEAAAEMHNAVIAVPYRLSAWTGNSGQNCWSYHGGGANNDQTTQHSDALINLANELKNDGSLNINEDRVYVTGLSSGGAMSLILGCKAPDVFAGVDGVAGPTVGSSQYMALQSPMIGTTVTAGISKCNSLAGNKSSSFDSQITHVTWGDMDKDGDHPGPAYSLIGANPAGKIALVSANYSKANYQVMQDVYGSSQFSGPLLINSYGGSGADQFNSVDSTTGQTKVSYLAIDNVGHAWPAGHPARSADQGGIWMAQHDMDYPLYILDWFEANNIRDGGAIPQCPEDGVSPMPPTIAVASVTGVSATLSVDSAFEYRIYDTSGNALTGVSNSNSVTLNDLSPSATYEVYAETESVCDIPSVRSNTVSFTTDEVIVPPYCEEVPAFNYYHKLAGRAYSEGFFWAPNYFATGSNDAMAGSTWGMTTLRTFNDSDWEVGVCP